ncbi:hypothetical protein DFH09DRAFT_1139090, partial [Mycena vulgaris]
MLQIRSSALSLFSFSFKGLVSFLGGFCIGAQVTANILLSSLSAAKNSSLRATRTFEIILLPTKCDLSNGTISSPYVALIAYATVVFASLFCILRAKGFTSSSSSTCTQPSPHGEPPSPDDPLHSKASPRAFSLAHKRNGVGNHPPSPPPEPDSSGSTDKPPRRNSWLFWLLLLLLAVVLLLGVSGIYICLTDNHSRAELLAVASPFIQHLSFLENGFFDGFLAVASYISTVQIYISLPIDGFLAVASYIATVQIHISLPSFHCCKILLLTLASHSGSIFIQARLSRLASFTATRILACLGYRCGVSFGTIFLLAFVSPLRWVLYALYGYGWVFVMFIVVPLADNQSFSKCSTTPGPVYSLWISLSSTDRSVMLGPTLIQLTILGVGSLLRGLMSVPFITSALRRQALWIQHRPFLVTRFLSHCLSLAYPATLASIPFVNWYMASELTDDDNMRILMHHPFLGWRWCDAARLLVVAKYRDMKSAHFRLWQQSTLALLGTGRTAFDSCLKTWEVLDGIPKLLIVAPVVVYYGYFHIIPAARRLPGLIRNWRRC